MKKLIPLKELKPNNVYLWQHSSGLGSIIFYLIDIQIVNNRVILKRLFKDKIHQETQIRLNSTLKYTKLT